MKLSKICKDVLGVNQNTMIGGIKKYHTCFVFFMTDKVGNHIGDVTFVCRTKDILYSDMALKLDGGYAVDIEVPEQYASMKYIAERTARLVYPECHVEIALDGCELPQDATLQEMILILRKFCESGESVTGDFYERLSDADNFYNWKALPENSVPELSETEYCSRYADCGSTYAYAVTDAETGKEYVKYIGVRILTEVKPTTMAGGEKQILKSEGYWSVVQQARERVYEKGAENGVVLFDILFKGHENVYLYTVKQLLNLFDHFYEMVKEQGYLHSIDKVPDVFDWYLQKAIEERAEMV